MKQLWLNYPCRAAPFVTDLALRVFAALRETLPFLPPVPQDGILVESPQTRVRFTRFASPERLLMYRANLFAADKQRRAAWQRTKLRTRGAITLFSELRSDGGFVASFTKLTP